MNDGVGVCTVCAKVCHKDHDITYAKYGSFFCDCGAKEDGSCVVSAPQCSSLGCNQIRRMFVPLTLLVAYACFACCRPCVQIILDTVVFRGFKKSDPVYIV